MNNNETLDTVRELHFKKIKVQKGITLIALVITIIVLLILAGISIATLTGENGVLTKASVAKDETKRAQYKEALELIGIELRPEQTMNQFSSKEYMDQYEEKIQEEIDKQDLWKGATKERKNDLTIWVTTEEGWIFQVTEKEVKYLGTREENPEPPTLQEAGIEFNYDPNDWTKNDVKVTITTKVEGFILQYTKEDPKNESAWKNYDTSTGITMTQNGDIHARLKNNLGEIGEYATGNVSKIDKVDPSIQVTQGTITSKSIVVNVTASDEQSGLATNNAYQYYLNGTLVPVATGSSYTFTGLNPSTKYTIRVIVYDKAGNDAEQTITPTTGSPTVAEIKGRFHLGNNNYNKRLKWKSSKSARWV